MSTPSWSVCFEDPCLLQVTGVGSRMRAPTNTLRGRARSKGTKGPSWSVCEERNARRGWGRVASSKKGVPQSFSRLGVADLVPVCDSCNGLSIRYVRRSVRLAPTTAPKSPQTPRPIPPTVHSFPSHPNRHTSQKLWDWNHFHMLSFPTHHPFPHDRRMSSSHVVFPFSIPPTSDEVRT